MMDLIRQNRKAAMPLRIFLAFFIFANVPVDSFAQLSRSLKQIPIGNSDYNGFARMDRIFYEMPMGNALNADFFFKFSTDPRQEPGYMGAYWTIPFFNSNAVKISGTRYVWKSPNHGTYTFNKIQVADKGFKETYVLNTTGKWKLNIAKDDTILIQNTDDIKSKYTLKDARLVSFCAGENCDFFRISYNGRKFPRFIYNVSKHVIEIEFVYGKDGLLSGIVFPRKKRSLFITYGTCNVLASDGITKLGGGLKSVASIVFPDGSKEEYEYSSEPSYKHRKYLTKKNVVRSVGVPTNKLVQTTGEKTDKAFIEWDAMTGLIISDSGGEYAIRNPLFDKYNLEYNDNAILMDRKRGRPTQESRISYKKPEYNYPEIWDYSIRNAVKVTQDPRTGEQTRISYIGNPGSSSMKIRKIEKKLACEKDWKMLLTKTYDDKGNLIREIDGLGNLKEFLYDDNNIISIKRNGAELYSMKYLVDGMKYEEEMFEDGKIKIYTKGRTKYKIEILSGSDLMKFTLWDGDIIKSIKVIPKK